MTQRTHVLRLGKTGLQVSRTAFGVLPIQRVPAAEAVRILQRAVEAGITFYDSARAYSDSEEKIGLALKDVRSRICLATKSGATTRTQLLADLRVSLEKLQTDHVDLLQLHNPAVLPDPNDPESSYAGLREARSTGLTRHIGITQHSCARAAEAVASGLYETLQFPLCYLSSAEDLALIELCRKHDVGLIAMKPLAGGLLTDVRAAFAFLRQYDNVLPIWGMQRLSELESIVELDAKPPALTAEIQSVIDHDRRELSDHFCRACGYCLPCPAEIPIPMAARMSLLLRRMPYQQFLEPEWRKRMERIYDCRDCGRCRDRCPYHLDPPAMLRYMLADYEQFCQEHGADS